MYGHYSSDAVGGQNRHIGNSRKSGGGSLRPPIDDPRLLSDGLLSLFDLSLQHRIILYLYQKQSGSIMSTTMIARRSLFRAVGVGMLLFSVPSSLELSRS